MYCSELLPDYMEYLEIERGRAKNTTINYSLYIERFIEFTNDIIVDKITTEIVRKYRLWLNRYQNARGEELSLRTQSYYLIALRGFLNYLSKRDIQSLAPNKIDLPKTTQRQVTFLHFDEIEQILAKIDTDTVIGLRDRAIIELLFSTGLRVSELISLNRDSINFNRLEFTVRGKNQKDRPVFVSERSSAFLKEYLNTRQDNLVPLFISYSKNNQKLDTSGNFRRLSARSVERMISKYSRLAGITKHVSPHTMRHSFATDLLMNGADIRSVQAMLGHSNISTTQVYTHVTDQHLRETHQKFHSEPPQVKL